MAVALLGEDIGALMSEDFSGLGLWAKDRAMLRSGVTWTALAVLFVKLPVGVLTFSVTVAVIGISGAYVTAFIYYGSARMTLGAWKIDTVGSAFALLSIGLVGLLLVPHLVNAQARLSGALAKAILSR